MKKLFITLICATGVFFASLYFVALPKAKSVIEKSLKDVGFTHVKIEKAQIKPFGLSIKKIILDKEGFSHISDLDAQFFWPAYLFQSSIETLTIGEINIVSITDNVKSVFYLTQKLNLSGLVNIPTNTLQARKISWETKTSEGILNFEGAITVQGNQDERIIQASLKTNQKQIGFDSQWTGSINNEGAILADGKVHSLHVDYGPLKINRANGWMLYKEDEKDISFSSQMEAGNGKFFDVPINNISLLIGHEEDRRPILFRADASGIEDVRLVVDIDWSEKMENEAMVATLNVDNLSDFLKYLKNLELVNINAEEISDSFSDTDFMLSYMPEKRFADGPLPFELIVNETSKEAVNGTLLIYPDTLDVRGTTKTNKKFLDLFQELMTISDENITDNVIRLEGNIKSLIEKPS